MYRPWRVQRQCFDDNRQEEIAIMVIHTEPEVLISPKYDRYHRNFNGKPGLRPQLFVALFLLRCACAETAIFVPPTKLLTM